MSVSKNKGTINEIEIKDKTIREVVNKIGK